MKIEELSVEFSGWDFTIPVLDPVPMRGDVLCIESMVLIALDLSVTEKKKIIKEHSERFYEIRAVSHFVRDHKTRKPERCVMFHLEPN